MPAKEGAMTSRADWYKHRSRLYYCYVFYSLGTGMSFGITFATEFLYIKNIIAAPHPVMFFTLGGALNCLMGIASGIGGSIYYDFTLNIRGVLFVCLFFTFIGNLLYSLPYSVAFVIVGNVFLGFVGIGMTCVAAEITHTYEEVELTRSLAVLAASTNIGMFITPCLAFLYKRVDVAVGNWRLSYGNMPGVIMCVYMFFACICHVCYGKNLAQEYDLKAEREEQAGAKPLMQNANDDEDSDEDDHKKLLSQNVEHKDISPKYSSFSWQYFKTYCRTFMGIALERHFGIVLLVCMLNTFTYMVGLKLIVIRSANDFAWGPGKIASVRLVSLVSAGLTSVAISLLSKKVMDFYLLYASNISTALAMMTVSTMPFLEHSAHNSTVVYYVSSVLLGVAESAVHILSTTMIAKLTKSEFQGIAEAVRFSVMFLSIALSGIGVNIAVPYTTAFCCVAVIFHAFAAVVLLFEHQFYLQREKL